MTNFFRTLLCHHKRKLVNQFEVASGVENMRAAGLQPTTWQKAVRKHVTDYQCEKCDHIKRFIVKTED